MPPRRDRPTPIAFFRRRYAVWPSDTHYPKVRGCIIISSGLGSDISNASTWRFSEGCDSKTLTAASSAGQRSREV